MGPVRGVKARNRAAALAGAAAAALLAWGWWQPADGGVPGWEPVNGQVAAAVASMDANGEKSLTAVTVPKPAASAGRADPAQAATQAAGAHRDKTGGVAESSNHEASVPPASSAAPGLDSGVGRTSSGQGQDLSHSIEGAPEETAASEAKGERLNINAATASELDALPGIGPAKAEAIVQYRESHGKFGSAEDLKNVKGIGDKLLDKLLPLVTAG